MQNRPTLMDLDEVMKYLRTSKSSVYRHITEGRLPPPIKTNGSTVWYESEVVKLVAKAAENRFDR